MFPDTVSIYQNNIDFSTQWLRLHQKERAALPDVTRTVINADPAVQVEYLQTFFMHMLPCPFNYNSFEGKLKR